MLDPVTVASGVSLLKRFWYVIPMALALGYAGYTHISKNNTIEVLQADLKTETRLRVLADANLDSAQRQIERLSGDVAKRARQYEELQISATQERKRLENQFTQSTGQLVRQLEDAAADSSRPACTISPEAQSALENL